jgi:uncharacterized damage-inducible protein DinB
MIDVLSELYAKNLAYAHRLLEDVPAARLSDQPGEGMNHPLWIVGHLAMTSDRVAIKRVLQLEPRLPDAWGSLFGPQSAPVADARQYPAMDQLLEALTATHQHVDQTLRTLDDTSLAEPTPDAGFAERFPTRGHALTHVLVGHENLHLGQLSAWRRMAGFGPVSLQ